MDISIVDAFTSKPFEGNPAAVAIVDRFPSDSFCRLLAMEINLSETVFVKPLSDDHFHIRWFTPSTEVDLCGHGTLAATHTLKEKGLLKKDPLVFDSLSGPLRVTIEKDAYVLDFPAIVNRAPYLPRPSEINHFGPIRESFIVSDTVVIEASSEHLVKNLHPNFQLIEELPERALAYTALSEDPNIDFISRFFSPKDGIKEDPVTGYMHCILAPHYAKKLGKTHFVAKQVSKRGGIIELELRGDRVLLKGQAVTVMTSKWIKEVF